MRRERSVLLRGLGLLLAVLAALWCGRGLVGAPETGRVSGRVLLPNGSAPPGVTIHLEPNLPQVAVPSMAQARPRQTRLGADGRFVFESVPCVCGWSLRVEGKGIVALPSYRMPVKPEAGGDVTRDIAAYRGGSIEGRITADGRPVGGAYVMTREQDPPAEARTGAGGHYRLAPVLPGRAAVHCEAKGCVSATSAEAAVTDGRTTRGVDAALRRGGTITGVVLLPDGKPAVDAQVGLVPAGDARRFAGVVLGSCGADGEGAFTTEPEPPGEYTLTAAWPPMTKARTSPPTHRASLPRVRVQAGRKTRIRIRLHRTDP